MSWRDNDQRADERDWVAAVIAASDEPLDSRAPQPAEADETSDPGDAEDQAAEQPAAVDPEAPAAGDEFEDASESVIVHAASDAAHLEPDTAPPPAMEPPPWWSAPEQSEPTSATTAPDESADLPDAGPLVDASSESELSLASVVGSTETSDSVEDEYLPPPVGPTLPALQVAVRDLIATVHDLAGDVRILRAKIETSSASQDRGRDDVARELSLTRGEIIEVTGKIEESTRSAFRNSERRTQELVALHEANLERKTQELFAQFATDAASVRDVERILAAVDESIRSGDAVGEKTLAALAAATRANDELANKLTAAVVDMRRSNQEISDSIAADVDRVVAAVNESSQSNNAKIDRLTAAVTETVQFSSASTERILAAVSDAGSASEQKIDRALLAMEELMTSSTRELEKAVQKLRARDTSDAAKRSDVEGVLTALMDFRRHLTGS